MLFVADSVAETVKPGLLYLPSMKDLSDLYKKLAEFEFNGLMTAKEIAMIRTALGNDNCTVIFKSTPLYKGNEPDGVLFEWDGKLRRVLR